jgi:hypothetical protein
LSSSDFADIYLSSQCFAKSSKNDSLSDLVWRNKYIRKETKSKIYKATVGSIMAYALEIRVETNQTNVGTK